jgi:DNA invertase Pin-like site-specific DNA recombinase
MSVEKNSAREIKKKRYEQDADTDLVFFEQEPEFIKTDWESKPLRVAVYCRVSTDNDNQATSFALQKKYYEEFVAQHPNWTLVGIYADEGLSATSVKKRVEFKRMLDDCEDGKIDLIITKSVSRFSRNVVDCLGIARNLLHAKHPVGIFFQEHNLNTLTNGNEMILTMMSSIAQAESETKRDTMLWSLDKRFSRGQFLTPSNNLLGYDTDNNGKLVINEEEAKSVRAIFKAFLAGYSLNKIAYLLSYYQRPTAKGNIYWSSSSVRGILINEKMCGDVVAQKTFTQDVLSHKTIKNIGQMRSVYKRNHHPAIISREEYLQALMLLKSKRGSKYFNADYMVQVIRRGLLIGFIPVNAAFGGYSPTHYMGAFEAANAETPPISGQIIDVKNATVTRIQEFAHSTLASVTISNKLIKFNTDCIAFFRDTAFIELLFHPAEKILAIRKTDRDNKNAVPWNTKPIAAGSLCKNIFTICGWDKRIRYKIMADCFKRNNERVMMFDLSSAEYFIQEAIEKLSLDKNGDEVKEWREVSKLLQPDNWQADFGRDVISHATTCRRWLASSLEEWESDAHAESVIGFDHYESFLKARGVEFQSDEDMDAIFGTYLESPNPTENNENKGNEVS